MKKDLLVDIGICLFQAACVTVIIIALATLIGV
jgi:hypothetical protein